MAPRKAAAKAAAKVPSLKDCFITFSGNAVPADAVGGKTYAQIKDEISNNGGTFVTKVAECTHLVVTEAQYNKANQKVKDAIDNDEIIIVSFEWLEKALEGKGPVDSAIYSLHDRKAAASSNGTTAAKVSTKSDPDDAEEDTTAADSKTKKTKGKKRKRDGDEEQVDAVKDEPDTKKAATNGSKAMNVTKNPSLNIPLDEGLASSRYTVYIADDSTIYDVTLNQSNSGKNANKFYRMQLLKEGTNPPYWSTWTRWGRVGEFGQTKMLGPGSLDEALAEFNKKFKDKTGNSWENRNGEMKKNKYVFIERSYEDDEDDGADELPGSDKRKNANGGADADEEETVVESKLPEPVQRLLKLIFNQDYFNATFDAFDYDAKKMPLGKLSKTSLMRGYDVLKQLSALVGSSGNSSQINDLSNHYLSLIPHVVSRSSRPPVLSSMDMIKKEIELLEALTDMQLANDLMKNAKKGKEKAEEVSLLDRQYEGLGMRAMDPVDPKSMEFKELQDYLTKSVGHTHGISYRVQDIFRIERNGEYDRFEGSQYSKVKNKNRRLLWHGSRATNFGGILSQGLRIAPPEAPVSGYMFGKGVYLADMSSKSANYCCSYQSGNTGLLLLCEAELGEPPLKLTGSDYNAGDKAKEKGHLSTWGVGQTAPKAWKDAKCIHPDLEGVNMPDVVSVDPGPTGEAGAYLQYNEYIVYDVAQIKLRYLFRVAM
ncbi:hypothetical protein H2198_007977 [Neophaeococcomyces mojaviensis]|uniref:Uncharacterized protein n=1 Tax=Neophaeococcomyces mojaviensis TaxID=3383035 RepID=A0ACC2ZYM5_9EURO|nr:hypothetical protein H2198_007977 [Knufia sp. JES_112]